MKPVTTSPPKPPCSASLASQYQAFPSQKNSKSYVTISVPSKLFWTLYALAIVFVSAAIGYGAYVVMSPKDESVPDQIIEAIGIDTYLLFRKHDRNGDGKLSLEEFEPIAHILPQQEINTTYEYEKEIPEDSHMISIQAAFTPLNMSTMTKDMDTIFAGSLDSLIGLKEWRSVAVPRKNFAASEFSSFLPAADFLLKVPGSIYTLVQHPEAQGDSMQGPIVSSNRYYPPRVAQNEELLHRLLSLLHPRPFLVGRFAPQGSLGCVRAFNDQYLDIVLRVHAEFQLNQAPRYPFWFSPSMFLGRLVISRDYKQVLHFRLYVPNDKKLNVDMEWLNGPLEAEQMEVDLGYMDRMEVWSAHKSVQAVQSGRDLRREAFESPSPTEELVEQLQWQEEVSETQCLADMERRFYPFKEVPYYNFTEVFRQAHLTGSLVHLVLMWGALDDQSC